MKLDPPPSSMPAFDQDWAETGPGSPSSRLDKADTQTPLACATCAQRSSVSITRSCGLPGRAPAALFTAAPLSEKSCGAGISSPAGHTLCSAGQLYRRALSPTPRSSSRSTLQAKGAGGAVSSVSKASELSGRKGGWMEKDREEECLW